MPPVAGIAIGAVLSGVMAGLTSGLVAGLIVGISTLGLGLLNYMLTPKPKGQALQGQTVQIREPASPWRIIHGLVRTSGTIVFAESTNSNQKLHLVICVSGTEVDALGTVQINDYFIYDDMCDDSGTVTVGKFANRVRIRKLRGETDQIGEVFTSTFVPVLIGGANNRDTLLPADFLNLPAGTPCIFTTTGTLPSPFVPDTQYFLRIYKNPNQATAQLRYRVYATAQDAIDLVNHIEINNAGVGIHTLRVEVNFSNQLADPFLVAETSATDTDRGESKALLYATLTWNPNVFQGGIPNLSVWVRGRRIFDPRDGTTRWQVAGALFVRDYLTLPETKCGIGALSTAVNDDSFIAAANICEEMVATEPLEHLVDSIDVTADLVVLTVDLLEFQYGDRVTVTSDGSNPGGLTAATNFFVIPVREAKNDVRKVAIRLAATFRDALDNVAIDITSAGSGQIKVIKNAEPRYAAGGAFQVNRMQGDILEDMLTSMAGRLIYSEGQWFLKVGAFESPAFALTDDHLRGGLQTQTKVTRADRFNAVKGLFLSPLRDWQPDDYPSVTNATYEAIDGKRIFTDFDLPYTTRPHTAQRLAKIELERHRQEITVKAPCQLSVLKTRTGDTISFTHPTYGWDEVLFDIVGWEFVIDYDDEDSPILAIDLSLRTTNALVYNWTSLEEISFSARALSTLPNLLNPDMPGAPEIDEQLYVTNDGLGVKTKAVVTWTPTADAFLAHYQLEFKLASASQWTVIPQINATTYEILDLAIGVYDFRVKAINIYNAPSEYATTSNITISGLLGIPADVTGLTGLALSNVILLRWTQHPDLDVKHGGFIVFRHSSLTSGASWSSSTSIGADVPGGSTVALLPLKPGTYLVKARDSSGLFSTNPAVVITTGASAFNFNLLNQVREDPDFVGTHDGTVGTDGILKLKGTTLLDSIADFDDIPDFDFSDGIVSSGIYQFANRLDLGEARRVRLRSHMSVGVSNVNDQIDSRVTNVDSWEDVDGSLAGTLGDAQIWVRSTDSDPDDPEATPIWTEYERLDVAEFDTRAFEFQARLLSTDSTYNIFVDEVFVDAHVVLDEVGTSSISSGD